MESVEVSRWEPADEEPLGTKPKQWLRSPGGELWLWKRSTVQNDSRHGDFQKGDDWSEVLAAGVGEALGVPVADVRLASRDGMCGIVSRSVLAHPSETLVHGNELLGEIGVGPIDRKVRSGYTVQAVAQALDSVGPPTSSRALPTAFDWFVGFLVLDALVGNNDRHEDNWATIRSPAGRRLAHSFDHASCLGFQISDEERQERLATTDPLRSVTSYARATRSRFEGRLHPIEAVCSAMGLVTPGVRSVWTHAMDLVPRLDGLMAGMPGDRMGVDARRFAAALYAENHTSLSEALRTMPS